jgi:hypothetical protein
MSTKARRAIDPTSIIDAPSSTTGNDRSFVIFA